MSAPSQGWSDVRRVYVRPAAATTCFADGRYGSMSQADGCAANRHELWGQNPQLRFRRDAGGCNPGAGRWRATFSRLDPSIQTKAAGKRTSMKGAGDERDVSRAGAGPDPGALACTVRRH